MGSLVARPPWSRQRACCRPGTRSSQRPSASPGLFPPWTDQFLGHNQSNTHSTLGMRGRDQRPPDQTLLPSVCVIQFSIRKPKHEKLKIHDYTTVLTVAN